MLSCDGSLPKYFHLREEVLKHWDYTFSDVLVYLTEVFGDDDDPFLVVSKLNVYRWPWIEMHLFLDGKRKSHLYVILEPLNRIGLSKTDRESPIQCRGMKGDDAMFVNIPQLVKSPEMLKFEALPVVVRLKHSNQCDCIFRESEGGFSYGDLCFKSVISSDREACVPTGLSVHSGKLVSQVVESRTKAANEISEDQGRIDWRISSPECYNMLASCNIVLGRGLLSLHFNKPLDPRLQGVKVYLRPTSFELGAMDTGLAHRTGFYDRQLLELKG